MRHNMHKLSLREKKSPSSLNYILLLGEELSWMFFIGESNQRVLIVQEECINLKR